MLQKYIFFASKKAIFKKIYTLYMYEDKKYGDEKMGFLIFAYRKLSLKRQINQKQFRQMQLSSMQKQVQEQMSIMEQAKSQMQDSANNLFSTLSNSTNCLFQAKMAASQSDYNSLYTQYQNDVAQKKGSDVIQQDLAKLEAAKTASDNQQKALAAEQALASAPLLAAKQAASNIFNTMDQAELQILHQKDQRYEEEIASLDSQLKTMNAELDSVEKAESDAAKKSAPTFGLS